MDHTGDTLGPSRGSFRGREGVENISFIDGVCICSWSCVKGLETALRVGLAEASKMTLAAPVRAEKMELVYNYLSGSGFQRSVEAFVTLQSDLQKKKRSMQAIWNRRQKQIKRAIGSSAGLYGYPQSIIGTALPAVDGLCLENKNRSKNLTHQLLVAKSD